MPNKKKFIDEKKAVVHKVFQRNYLDPERATSEYVLVPVERINRKALHVQKFFGMQTSDIVVPLSTEGSSDAGVSASEQTPDAVVPASAEGIPVFPWKKEAPETDPEPDWDPDVMAALADDFDHKDPGNALEDDFIVQANGTAFDLKISDNPEGAIEDDDSDGGMLFSDDDDDKSEFPQYPLTSAPTSCSEHVKIFNERFNKLYEEHYGNDEIGDFDFEVTTKCSNAFESKGEQELVDDFEKFDKKKRYAYDNHIDEDLKAKILGYAQRSRKEKPVKTEHEPPPPQYDCESILSTYSNKYNHPTSIKVEKEEKAGKISACPWKQSLTKSHLKRLDEEPETKDDDEMSDTSESIAHSSIITSFCGRPEGETPEERKRRKELVKQMRRENRRFKKQNKLITKGIKRQQTAMALNAKRTRFVHLP